MTPQLPDQPMPVPRHVWRHTGFWGASGLLGAWVLAITRLPLGYVAGAWLLAGVITLFCTLAQAGAGATPLAWCGGAWGAVLAAWTAWARIHGPYHWLTVATLVVPGAILAVLTAQLWTNMLEEREAARLARLATAKSAELARWSKMFEGLGIKGVITERTEKTRAGKDVYLRLPVHGKVKMRRLEDLAENIAIALKLHEDAITFERGPDHAGQVVMHVNQVDILSETVPFPDFTEPLTITRPLPVGLLGDGRPMQVLFREVQCMLIGVTGSGKSNLLNVLCALITQCPDAVIWMIDFKRGRLAAPWVRPYAEGRCEHPAIDWVATTRAEAELMLRCFEAISEARMSSLMGGSAIEPDESMPQIILLVDEASDITGMGRMRAEQLDEGISNARMSELASRVTRKVRSEAMQVVWGMQRGGVSMTGSGDLKSQCMLRFVLRVASEQDAQMALPDDKPAQAMLARLRHNGSGLVWTPSRQKPQPVKFYRLDTKNKADMDRTLELARQAGNRRPQLHRIDIAAAGEDYAQRWERSELLTRLRPAGQPAPPAAEQQAQPVATLEREPRPQPPREQHSPQDLAAAFRLVTEGLTLEAPPALKNDRQPLHLRIHALMAERMSAGYSVDEMWSTLKREVGEENTPTKRTIHRWMDRDFKDGIVENRHNRWYLRRDRGQS